MKYIEASLIACRHASLPGEKGRAPMREATKRVAVFDIGANTVRVLVADIDGRGVPRRTLLDEGRVTGLGEQLACGKILSERGMRRAEKAVKDMRDKACMLGAVKFLGIGTSPFRVAVNAAPFIRRIRAAIRGSFFVLSGKEESEAVYGGVSLDKRYFYRSACVIDIGGGSTEIIHGFRGRVRYASILPFGCLSFGREFSFERKLSAADAARLRADIDKRLGRHSAWLGSFRGILVGVGGSITQLGLLDVIANDIPCEALHGHSIAVSRVTAMFRMISSRSRIQRLRIKGMEKERAESIVPGCAILASILDIMRQKTISVSLTSIRHGALRLAV